MRIEGMAHVRDAFRREARQLAHMREFMVFGLLNGSE